MKIIIDENIPYTQELFNNLGYIDRIPSCKISTNKLRGADALIVRSVTKVNEKLLKGTSVKFVGTATSGIDHVDDAWLKKAGIHFSSASGCNAVSVVEYIFSAFLILAERDNFLLTNRSVGIVGVGNIGKYLQKLLKSLGIRTLLCDPKRAAKEKDNTFYSIDELIEEVDIISFHTPLIIDGPYKTLHLADYNRISRLKTGTILINTSRGPVVDNNALLKCLKNKQEISVVLDVWDSEPNINVELLKLVDIGTAHIAGYTLEGRARSSIEIFKAYSSFIGKTQTTNLYKLLPKPEFNYIEFNGLLTQHSLKRLISLVYDIRQDDALLRKTASIPGKFEMLRQFYLDRREWSSLFVKCNDDKTATILQNIGFSVIRN